MKNSEMMLPIDKKNNEKKMTRRDFIKKTGSTVLVLSFGGLVWRAIDQGVFSTGKGPAYEPWDISRERLKEGPLAIVNDAILASNPHNTQPWLFKVNESYIELYADEVRNLGAIDPFRREMYIGLGCAIENMMLSAKKHGYNPQLSYVPNKLDHTCIARIDLKRAQTLSPPLYEAIAHRHTHRGEYDVKRTIEQSTLKEIEGFVSDEKKVRITWFTSPEQKQTIGDLIIRSTEAIISDKEMSAASNQWIRDDWKDLQKYRDGVTLDAQGGSSFIRAAGKILPPLSDEKNDQFWLASTKNTHVATASAYGLISVKDASDNVQRARAGRAWQRMHLHGTTLGLGMQPLSQLNEMSDREKQLGNSKYFSERLSKITGDNGWEGLQIFRLGYPLKNALPSPRRAVDDVIL